MYSSTISLTSALDGLSGQRHAPAALPPGKSQYPMYRKLGGPQGRYGRVRKISSLTWIRSPDRTNRSELLYSLRFPRPLWQLYMQKQIQTDSYHRITFLLSRSQWSPKYYEISKPLRIPVASFKCYAELTDMLNCPIRHQKLLKRIACITRNRSESSTVGTDTQHFLLHKNSVVQTFSKNGSEIELVYASSPAFPCLRANADTSKP
jgi:hypothetical protein